MRRVRLNLHRRAVCGFMIFSAAISSIPWSTVTAVAAHPPTAHDADHEEEHKPSKPASPFARVSTTLHDFGVVRPGAELLAEFPISNIGTFELEILKIEPTYGCSLVGTPPKIIQTGETQPLRVKVDAQTLQGHFEKQVVLRTSDIEHATIFLTLRGEMRRAIDVTPAAAGFGKIAPTDMRERILTLTNNDVEPISVVLEPPSADSPFVFQLVETVAGFEYKLYVNTRPPYSTGSLRSEAVLRTSVPSQSEIHINAYAIVPAMYEVVPAFIPIVPISAHPESTSRSTVHVLQFNNFGEQPIRVTGATSNDPAVLSDVFEVNPGKRYRIAVSLPPRYRPAQSGAYVTLATDNPEVPTLDIPIGSSPTANRVNPQPPHPSPQAPSTATKPQPPAPANQTASKPSPILELIGKPAPQLSLVTLDGAPVSNVEYEFHPATVLNFFAPNCGFSKKQIPKVEMLRARYEPLGVRFVNICETMRQPFTPDQVAQVMAEVGSNLELAMDSGNRYGRAYKVSGFPSLFVIRPDGKVDHVVSGNKSNLEETVSAKLDAILGGLHDSGENKAAGDGR
ncbi:MAG: DUF1573 domain-containing protein [Phycisphaerae bacterium]|nr:DUF1573 domain-containing protein [Phycisphaerae bacterium]